MKTAVLFGSTSGNTRLVAKRLPDYFDFDFVTKDIADVKSADELQAFDFLIFMASTWGDGELQLDMEMFFVNHSLNLKGKYFTSVELGNYYGYDDFEYGALRIMQQQLESAGAAELVEPFCMDSLPKKDWDGLKRWCTLVNSRVKESG